MPGPVRLALVQMFIDHKDRQSNWDNARLYVEKAAQQKCDLIVFPEFFLGGPGRKSVTNDGKDFFSSLAQKHHIDIVPGTLIEADEHGHMLNTSYYIDNQGTVLLKYDKVNLWQQERRYLQPGYPRFPTAQTRFGFRVGICACWDLAVPEVSRHLAMKGNAQLIIVPSYWTLDEQDNGLQKFDPESEIKLINSLCSARAFENEVCMAFCNAAQRLSPGSQQQLPFGILAGASRVAVPFKGTIGAIDGDHQDMLVVDVDVCAVSKNAEAMYQIRADYQGGRVKPRL
ncbi:carbon-nitrogen hydrolase [Hesseltinella vesiculosa]|uniref:Carbon-nitrogen hydrolase n=1 Tax=Hesseltinella vesiculosa TaxID=101127 RepID=A0A1X2GFU0_9FUNG|nr:carbon-nitrogen hydrolase [Hesseltinella vesiculosa]